MKEPIRIPLDPSTPKAKSVNKIPLPKIYPEPILDDVYTPDNNKLYIPINNEDSKQSTET